MLTSNRLAIIAGLASAMAGLPPLNAQDRDRDEGNVQEAIRFEKAKEAAAERQQRIEDQQGRGQPADRADSTAKPKKAPERKTKASGGEKKTPPRR